MAGHVPAGREHRGIMQPKDRAALKKELERKLEDGASLTLQEKAILYTFGYGPSVLNG
jgi:hypothetical protein